MQKGHYKCLFCDDVIKWDYCECLKDTSRRILHTFLKQCNNLHSLEWETYSSCPFCNTNNDIIFREGSWGFGTMRLPGRLTLLRFYDFNNKVWTVSTKRELLNAPMPLTHGQAIILNYSYYEYRRRQQLYYECLEWLLCSKRISRNLINKDIVRKIAKLLDSEPYGMEVQIENEKK